MSTVSPSLLYAGSPSVPIVFAEIVPVVLAPTGTSEVINECNNGHRRQQQQGSCLTLTNFGVKRFLLHTTKEAQRMTINSFTGGNSKRNQFIMRWKENECVPNRDQFIVSGYVFRNNGNKNDDIAENIDDKSNHRSFPIVYIPSDNPTSIKKQPCCIIAYTIFNRVMNAGNKTPGSDQTNESICQFSQDTLVRILPPRSAMNSLSHNRQHTLSSSVSTIPASFSMHLRRESMLLDLLGDEGSSNIISDEMVNEVLQNHNQETVGELNLKLSAVMVSVQIGTTRDAFRIKDTQEQQIRKIKKSIQAFTTESKQLVRSGDDKNSSGCGSLRSWPSLIVHSPNHGDGKTLLVQALAKSSGYSSIHVIRPGALLAKYGVRADAALESQIHAILISAACRNKKICIIVDQLDAILPSRLSGRSSTGDAAFPVFNAIASYFRKITDSMQRKQEFPFPLKNPLYNPTNGSSGQVLTAELCLVGIVTCPDGGWRSHLKTNGGSMDEGSTILDCMISDRYRIPMLRTKTKLSAFDTAFSREGIALEACAQGRLAQIVGSARWIKGSVFRRVAKQLRWILMDNLMYDNNSGEGKSKATLQDLVKALALVKANMTDFADEDLSEADSTLDEKESGASHFGSIGGNVQAKVSLEDALAFDHGKREMLSKFGLSPPTGVLLYGPPGCGKTLLAKAVARLMRNPTQDDDTSSSLSGGTFISLSISEIVSAEVGTSEKTIASSFEYAGKHTPSVIFLDEFQALFTDRNRGGSGKLTTTLLQCLDDIKKWYEIDTVVNHDKYSPSLGGKRVIVIGATNTPWMIDSAFLRPGRLDRVVYVGLPNISERKSILQVHIKRMRVDAVNSMHLIHKLCEDLAILTEGFSGADIAALCRSAAIRALEEGEHTTVQEHHFKESMEHDCYPSSDDVLVKKLKNWRP